MLFFIILQKKRKRSGNTSREQIELYLDLLENDEIFRTGVLNPTVKTNYTEEKWEMLTVKLNCIGTGPVLTTSVW